ncbi:MAG: hypothetical protein K2Q01_06925, partial [Rickettsiales bacterium]|nr:hypothetical protein [Rickettsiales bacterium]
TSHVPQFIRMALGPQLERLPSFTPMDDDGRKPKGVAMRAPEHGIPGLGEVMETTHADMRLVGSKLGRLFMPAHRGVLPPTEFGIRFAPDEARKLIGIDKVTIQPDPGLPPLVVSAPNILYRTFMMGAEARAHLSRSPDEKELLKNSVGTLKRSYDSLNELLGDLRRAMAQNPAYKGKTPASFGLRLDNDAIITAFTNRQKEFATAYNYLYVSTGGMLDMRLQKLRWAMDNNKRPSHGFTLETGQDVSAVVTGLYDLVAKETKNLQYPKRMEELARSTPEEAARLLEMSHTLPELRRIAEKAEHGFTAFFMANALERLEAFQHQHLTQNPATRINPASGADLRPHSNS